jgi:hypothetical protein
VFSRLENGGCTFSSTGQPFAIYLFHASSGTVIDAFATSNAFRPQLLLYTSSGGAPIAADTSPGFTISELGYDFKISGDYGIAVDGYNGETSGSFGIQVFCHTACLAPFSLGPPTFTPVIVPYGGTTTLTARDDGSPTLSYSWYNDSTSPFTTIGTSSSLRTASLFQTTRFHVHVSNSCGAVDDYATVPIPLCNAPMIQSQPVSVAIPYNGQATFTVTAAGDQPLTYQWYRGAYPDTSQPIGTNFASVTLSGLTSPTGIWVHVSNACGFGNSSTAYAFITSRPKRRAVGR